MADSAEPNNPNIPSANVIASHEPVFAVTVSGSPIGLHETITENNFERVYAADIKSVWVGDRESGWLYEGSDHNRYFQENLQTSPQQSWSVDGRYLPVIGQALESVHGAVAASANSPQTAPIQKLDSSKTLESQLPPGSQVLDGIQHHSHSLKNDGIGFDGSPESVGDQIPNGTSRGTTVTDINAIVDESVKGETAQGWVYQGSDGHKYFQQSSAGRWSGSASGSIGPVSGSATEPTESGIHRYETGDIKPGESLLPMSQQSKQLDLQGLGLNPSMERKLSPGQSSFGSVLAVNDEHVVQNAGRGNFFVYECTDFPISPKVGDQMTISMQRNGDLIASIEPRSLGPELGRA